MNPFLERHWGDVHSSLVLYARNQLNRQLPGSLRARVEERLVVENPETEERRAIKPDVKVHESPRPRADDDGGVAVLAPPVVEPDVLQLAEDEPETTTYLKVIDTATGGTLVTVIEFLSPANKQPRGVRSADQYLAKREELKLAGVSLVEVDLLRGGERFFPEYGTRHGKCLAAAYAACVRRGWHTARYEAYSFQLRERLPAIRIPLRKSDTDVVLNLQALVDQVYEDGRYDDLDYGKPLDPPLGAQDAEWVKGRVSSANTTGE